MAASLKLVEGKESKVDRQKALDAALSQIDRAFGKGSAMKLGSKEAMEVESISTGSLGLDIALGIGGLPKGRVIEVYGPESSGKTTLALHVIAEAQKNGGTAAFVDARSPRGALPRMMCARWASISCQRMITPFWLFKTLAAAFQQMSCRKSLNRSSRRKSRARARG
jgi:Cdc6-like AAA superfamily ATPase